MEYSNANNLKNRATKVFIIVFVLVFLFAMYEIVYAIYIDQTTGLLQVTASDSSAIITVTQAGHSSENIGIGKSKAHLKPGSYTLIASLNKNQTITNIQVIKKVVTTKYLTLAAANQNQLDKNNAANNLIKILPFTGPNFEYKISYLYTYEGSVANPIITITPNTPSGQQDALNWLRGQGYNPSELTIQILNPVNNSSGQ